MCQSGPAVGSLAPTTKETPQATRSTPGRKLPGLDPPFTPRKGRCPPPPSELPPRTCSLYPEHFEIEIGDVDSIDFSACCPALPVGEDIDYEYSAEFGTCEAGDEETTNCEGAENIQYEPPDFECLDTITCNATWSDGGKCTAYSYATVVEPANGD